jgi:hypothetical protein
MTLLSWFEAMQQTTAAGAKEVEITLRCVNPGQLYEAKCGRKRVVGTDIEAACSGLLNACGGRL